jgi:hypothetical protein
MEALAFDVLGDIPRQQGARVRHPSRNIPRRTRNPLDLTKMAVRPTNHNSEYPTHDSGDEIEVPSRAKQSNKVTPLKSVHAENSNPRTKNFEFVTLTNQLPSKATRNEIAKKVRTHAMRDYLRKQNSEAMTGIVDRLSIVPSKEPSQYQSRFKLDSWTHKTREKALRDKRAKPSQKHEKDNNPDVLQTSSKWQISTSLGLSVLSSDLDPFDTLSVKLRPLSQRLLVHCKCTPFVIFSGY